ncbi:hypothetical protein PROFUN_13958 [Planoprotostelium fungivorum]|uniref:Uncharacterized protein n=1 Tax=Planoprotostelium fungivorum TaxID=1890364 RepID=A0A2P6N2H5_9EUKA|nr:hypothetical protein PROFUN_13958 [Planoprotostelium fungivorum]
MRNYPRILSGRGGRSHKEQSSIAWTNWLAWEDIVKLRTIIPRIKIRPPTLHFPSFLGWQLKFGEELSSVIRKERKRMRKDEEQRQALGDTALNDYVKEPGAVRH